MLSRYRQDFAFLNKPTELLARALERTRCYGIRIQHLSWTDNRYGFGKRREFNLADDPELNALLQRAR